MHTENKLHNTVLCCNSYNHLSHELAMSDTIIQGDEWKGNNGLHIVISHKPILLISKGSTIVTHITQDHPF